MNLRQTAVLMGHNAPIYALLPYGDEGEQWLSAAGDGWVVVWDLRTGLDGRLLMQVEGSIFCLHRLYNAQELAVGTMQGGLYWLDIATNTPLMQELAHAGGIFALHSDADHLYTGGGDGRLVRWSRTTRRKIETLHLSHKPLRCFCPSPDGATLWVGSSDGAIYAVDLTTFSLRTRTPAHENSVFSLLYLPPSARLVSGGRDARIHLWAADAPDALRLLNAESLPAHLFTVNSLALSPCGQYIASASRDKTVKIWRSSDLMLLRVVDTIRHRLHHQSINCLLWQKNRLITGSDDRTMMAYSVSDCAP